MVKCPPMKGIEEKVRSMTLGASKHSALVLALFLLAALIALASGLVGPASASAIAVGAPPNRVWKNWVGTARYEFVGFIGQIYRHATTETHIATGYAGSPTAIPARRTVTPTTPQQPHASPVRAEANHFGRDPPVQLPLHPRYDGNSNYNSGQNPRIVAEDVGEKAPGLLGKIGGWIRGLFGKTEDIGASKRVIGNAERSFLNSEHFESLPVSGTVDPSKIRFSQASAGASFKAGGGVDKLATDLKSGAVKPEDVPPIRIVVRDGQVYTLDNRRLAAFQRAGVQIHYVKLDAIPKGEMYKFTTTNHGVDIQLRRPSQ